MSDVTAEEARKLFKYDPETGRLEWAVALSRIAKKGRPCLCRNSSGYRTVRIHGKSYVVHRIIWLMMTGSFPEATIDHINRDRSDNRWRLRVALETIAEERDAGRHDGIYEACPAHEDDVMFAIARKALEDKQ